MQRFINVAKLQNLANISGPTVFAVVTFMLLLIICQARALSHNMCMYILFCDIQVLSLFVLLRADDE